MESINKIQPNTPKWYEARVGKITASRVGKILGHSQYGDYDSVMREMVREYFKYESELKDNIYMEWGRTHEKHAIADLKKKINLEVHESYFIVHPKFSWLGATPDGFASDGALVECKCPRVIRELSQDYIDQMQLQMVCAQAKSCWFVQWTPDKTEIIKVDRDESWLPLNYPKLRNFIDDYTNTLSDPERYQPHLNPLVKHMESNEWLDLTQKLKSLHRQIKQLTGLEKELKGQLIDMAEEQKCEGNGVLVYPTKRRNVDYKALVNDAQVNLEKYQKESMSWTVKIKDVY